MPPSAPDRAHELLCQMLGPEASFRDGQLQAIVASVEERARTLIVQRTGWGKSLVYFIASKILREQGAGPTLLISPLLSLMRNQVEAAERIGIRAARLDSETRKDWDAIESRLAANDVDVLLVSPERLANQRFQTETIPLIAGGMGLLVVDEAHCISDWGHDFRPDYRRIVRIVQGLPASGSAFASELGRLCARSRVPVFSGGARGVDTLAVDGALEQGGQAAEATEDVRADDQFPIVWPRLAAFLAKPRTEAEVADAFHLQTGQATAWLQRAVEHGLVRKLSKPTRFERIHAADDSQASLFEP